MPPVQTPPRFAVQRPARRHDRSIPRLTPEQTTIWRATVVNVRIAGFLAVLAPPLVLVLEQPPDTTAALLLIFAVGVLSRSSGRYRQVRTT